MSALGGNNNNNNNNYVDEDGDMETLSPHAGMHFHALSCFLIDTYTILIIIVSLLHKSNVGVSVSQLVTLVK